jgi:hypothetical protein
MRGPSSPLSWFLVGNDFAEQKLFCCSPRAHGEIQRDLRLLQEPVPQVHGERGVKEGEPGHKVLLESYDCVFRSAASMTMRRHQLIRDITDGEEILHGCRCFVVKSLKLWPETFDSEFLMDAVICFDPFLGGPLLHGNDFKKG